MPINPTIQTVLESASTNHTQASSTSKTFNHVRISNTERRWTRTNTPSNSGFKKRRISYAVEWMNEESGCFKRLGTDTGSGVYSRLTTPNVNHFFRILES
ncbi:MAG: hypothetical protein FJ267_07140 [Planctomycetes bacterium]|nr:hypothetical protein [Planctomycetota bacterium]